VTLSGAKGEILLPIILSTEREGSEKQVNFGDFGNTGNFGNCEFMKDLKD